MQLTSFFQLYISDDYATRNTCNCYKVEADKQDCKPYSVSDVHLEGVIVGMHVSMASYLVI